MEGLDGQYCHAFPAVRGQQAGRLFYIATCPLRLIPKIFMFDEEEVPAELRAQRQLNATRIPEIARYLVDNDKDYVLSALTASINARAVEFESSSATSNLGTLKVPMEAPILINDGQHRRKAIEEAVKEKPELGHDNIAVLFFVDEGLKRSQQMFADLNKHAVKPSPSLAALYDHRDLSSELARQLAADSKPFAGFTEMERNAISKKSSKLFTLSGIKQATRALLGKGPKDGYTDSEKQLAGEFWVEVNNNLAEWQMVQNKELSPANFREEYIHAHGIGLQALGVMGHTLLDTHPKGWKRKLKKLNDIDWRKTNPLWANRAMQHGKLSKATSNIHLTAVAIKKALELPTTEQEQQLERDYL